MAHSGIVLQDNSAPADEGCDIGHSIKGDPLEAGGVTQHGGERPHGASSLAGASSTLARSTLEPIAASGWPAKAVSLPVQPRRQKHRLLVAEQRQTVRPRPILSALDIWPGLKRG